MVTCKQCCGSGSAWIRNFCLDPDPELLFQIRIQKNMKEQINKNVIFLWILDFVYCRTEVWNRIWQIDDRIFFTIEFKVVYNFQIYLKNMGWIRIRMDQELLPGSGYESGTRKTQSWIRIRNKSFRIHNTGCKFLPTNFSIFDWISREFLTNTEEPEYGFMGFFENSTFKKS